MGKEYYTLTEAAAYLGKSTKTIYNMLKDGRLTAIGSRADKRSKVVTKKQLDAILNEEDQAPQNLAA